MEEQRPHLVLLDLVLPDADGINLMKSILRMADVPVIFVSGYGKDQIIAQAFAEGATDYIVKPFSPTELVARVKAALRKQANPYRIESLEPYVLGDLTIDYVERCVDGGRPAGGADCHRVWTTLRAFGQRWTGVDSRPVAAKSMGPAQRRRCAGAPHPHQETPLQAE